ncbi:MAG: hypothetical protein JXB34_00910 [Bacteroidales bacterium]|nr:hypothetical protein [Bacteroidales bacterium]
MKKILPLFITTALLTFACKSSSKLIEEGNYDKAIDKSIKSVLKGKADDEEIDMLDRAYKLANTRDLERIKLLKAEGKPENWEQVYYIYSSLDYRQKEVRKVLPLRLKGRVIDYEQIDYTNSIVEAKTKAAEHFYTNGKRLMQVNTKQAYREAYFNFNKAQNFRGSAFSDVNELIADAEYLGTSRVLVDVSNNTPFRLPPEFYDNLLSFNTTGLNSQWVEYYLRRSDRQVDFDYFVTIQIKNIIVSPERFNQKEFIRKKKVQDGFSYVLDDKGNVKKDSLGNDIKVPKYKELVCTVLERQQIKEATVEVQIEYMSLNPNRRVMKMVPIAATSFFEHFSGKAVGDLDALTPDDLNLINRDPAPFPDDLSMIYDCTATLQKAITDAMHSNKNLIY